MKKMKKNVIVLVLFLLEYALGAMLARNDTASTKVNTPICIPVLDNDDTDLSTEIIYSANISGWTFFQYDPFFLANDDATVAIEAENYLTLNYRGGVAYNTAYDPYSWQFTSDYSDISGRGAMVLFPNYPDQINTLNYEYGAALIFPVAFREPGNYYLWVRGRPCYGCLSNNDPTCGNRCMGDISFTQDDSCHLLLQQPNGTLNFVSAGMPVNGYQLGVWGWQTVNETDGILVVDQNSVEWPPKVFQVWIAMRENGFVADRLIITKTPGNYTEIYGSSTGDIKENTFVKCASGEILFVPEQNFTGISLWNYTLSDGSSNVTAWVEVCVDCSNPSPSPVPVSSSSSSSGSPIFSWIIPAAVGVGGACCLLCLLIALILFIRSRKPRQAEDLPKIYNLHEPLAGVSPTTEYIALTPLASNENLLKAMNIMNEKWVIEYPSLLFEKEIGAGAFGVVYRGKWQGVPVAIKKSNETKLTAKQMEDVILEFELMKKLKGHPNVLHLMGLCLSPLCIVTEFMENGSLYQWLQRSDTQDKWKLKQKIACGIAAGVKYLHFEKIIHRDLAARNILLTDSFVAKVADFGMSRLLAADNGSHKTTSDIGPVRWMAPESIQSSVYNEKTDVWSFGVLLYELLTHGVPYGEAELVTIATRIVLRDITVAKELEANAAYYPEKLVKIALQCLQIEPEKRPSFSDILTTLES